MTERFESNDGDAKLDGILIVNILSSTSSEQTPCVLAMIHSQLVVYWRVPFGMNLVQVVALNTCKLHNNFTIYL